MQKENLLFFYICLPPYAYRILRARLIEEKNALRLADSTEIITFAPDTESIRKMNVDSEQITLDKSLVVGIVQIVQMIKTV